MEHAMFRGVPVGLAKVSVQVEERVPGKWPAGPGGKQAGCCAVMVNCQAAVGRMVIILIHLLLWNISSGIICLVLVTSV